MSNFESPIPLSEIEAVLAWVDTFKLSRPTKKINRDFSDAVLLAEMLSVHYPKLVEMHNYPPRNSHSLKLNNWLTLNRKVLKKLRLNLCINTMEQLANCQSGIIERVLIMVRDKIRRDEELNKSMKDTEQNMSSGGSFYEACGEEENVLVVPVKVRVNGVLESVQQKVVNYNCYLALKEELKDARDSNDLLKQKVEHLDSLLHLKQERIEELQKQLDRKQARRKEAEAFQNSLQVPFETVPSPLPQTLGFHENLDLRTPIKSAEIKPPKEESKIPIKTDAPVKPVIVKQPKDIPEDVSKELTNDIIENAIKLGPSKLSYTKFSTKTDVNKLIAVIETDESLLNKSITNCEKDKDVDLDVDLDVCVDVDRIKSDVFKEIEIIDERVLDEFEDSEQNDTTSIGQTIQNEIKIISNRMEFVQEY